MRKLPIVLIILTIACSERPSTSLLMKGLTQNEVDGTVLLLENLESDEIIDSAVIYNNRFEISANLKNSPVRAMLHKKDYTQYRVMWLENSNMQFDASTTDFRSANVSGSKPESLNQELSIKIESMQREESLKIEMEFVKSNPTSIVSANILNVYSSTWGKEKTQKMYDQLSLKNKNSSYGKQIDRFLKLNRDIQIGKHYEDFDLPDPMGKTKKLSDFDGNIVLLEFWASWCGPCRKENPNLVKTYEKFKAEGFQIFAVSLDADKSSWIEAIDKDKLNWNHVSDLNGDKNKAALIYGVSGIPDNYLINRDGIILAKNLRGDDLSKKLAEIFD